MYKNDLILIKDAETGESILLRFLSRNDMSSKNKVELKPYDKEVFFTGEQLISKIGTTPKDVLRLCHIRIFQSTKFVLMFLVINSLLKKKAINLS